MSTMLARLRAKWSTAHTDVLKVLGANVARNGLRGVLKLVVAGCLTTQAFGVYRAVYSLFRIVASLARFGLDRALVKFVATAISREDDAERDRVLKTVLVLEIVIVSLLVVAGNLFAGTITRAVFEDPGLELYVRLLFLAVGGQLLWHFMSNYLAAHQQFGKSALFVSSMPVLMLIAAVILVLRFEFTTATAILLYLFAPGVTALLWLPAFRWSFLRAPITGSGVARKLVQFSRWIWITDVVSTVRNDINPILLKNPSLMGSLSAAELNAGLYSFGGDLANEVTIFSQSLFTVLLPKASQRLEPRELSRFVRRAYWNLALVMIPMAALIFLGEPFVRLLAWLVPQFGYERYLPAMDAFRILYAGGLFTVAAVPMRTVFYSLGRPEFETRLEMAMAVVLVAGALLLIPRYGYIGAAWVVFFQRALTSATLFVGGHRTLRRLGKE